MKLALVGTGKWAQNIARSLPPGVELAAVVSSRTDLPATPRVYPSVAELPLDHLDGVVIANTAEDHLLSLMQVWQRNEHLPVFIEKPVAMHAAGAEDFEAMMTGGWFSDTVVPDGTLLVDHTQLFNQNLIDLKRDLDGVPPADIHGVDRGVGPFRADCNPLWDYGPHAVAVALYLTGFPFPGGVHVRDAWLDKNEHGASIDFELQLGAKTRAQFTVGNNALEKARHCSVRSLSGVRRTWEGQQACAVPPLTAALAAFCSAVEAGHAPEGDARFGWALPLEVTRILADIEEVLRKRCTPLA